LQTLIEHSPFEADTFVLKVWFFFTDDSPEQEGRNDYNNKYYEGEENVDCWEEVVYFYLIELKDRTNNET